ncbi:MAG: hypothetical protein OEZ15_08550 [Gammaproteobacteria bacterium]|nr:hypothetical protein [Gammaproteobacteria bacterium]
MYRYLPLLVTAFIITSGCSDSADTQSQQTSTDNTATKTTQPHKISQDNPFSTQVNALDAARAASESAQQSIDSDQQRLEDAQP